MKYNYVHIAHRKYNMDNKIVTDAIVHDDAGHGPDNSNIRKNEGTDNSAGRKRYTYTHKWASGFTQ